MRGASALLFQVVLVFGGLSLASALSADCGDAILQAGEQCDDGNSVGGDGCSATCQVEPGYSCSAPIAPDLSNVIADPGFEAGLNGGIWIEESAAFGTPICNLDVCGVSGQRSGDHWAWMGGVIFPEEALLAQTVVIPETASGLTFWLRVPLCDSAADYMEVLVDDSQVWEMTGDDAACGINAYSQRSIDITAWADGAEHQISFHVATFAAELDSSDFHLDDIELVHGPVEPIPSVCQSAGDIIFVSGFE